MTLNITCIQNIAHINITLVALIEIVMAILTLHIVLRNFERICIKDIKHVSNLSIYPLIITMNKFNCMKYI